MDKILIKTSIALIEGTIGNKLRGYSSWMEKNNIKVNQEFKDMVIWWKLYSLGLLSFSKIFNKVYSPDKWLLTSSGAVFCHLDNFIEIPADYNFTVYHGFFEKLIEEIKNSEDIIIKNSGVSNQLGSSNYIHGVFKFNQDIEIEFTIFEETEYTGFHFFDMQNIIEHYLIDLREGNGIINVLSLDGLILEYGLLFIMEFDYCAEPLDILSHLIETVSSNTPEYGELFIGCKAPFRLNKLRFLGAKNYDDIFDIVKKTVNFYEKSFHKYDIEIPEELDTKFIWFPDVSFRFVEMGKNLKTHCCAKNADDYLNYYSYVAAIQKNLDKNPESINTELKKLTDKDFDIHFYIYYNYIYRKKTDK
jgi:hypothetical protein